jgi:hypothetical protein
MSLGLTLRDEARRVMRMCGLGGWLILCLALASSCGKDRPKGGEDQAPPEDDAGVAGERVGAGAAGADSALETSRPPDRTDSSPTGTEMKDVDFQIAEGIVLQVRHLRGESVSVRPGQPVILDDKNSYRIRIETAETAIGYPDMSRLMNDFVFAYDGAPVKDLEITQDEDEDQADQIELKGRLAALGVPFEIEGKPEPTPDGMIRIRTTSIQALDLEVSGLMDLLDLESKDLIGNLEDRGVRIEENDVVLIPNRALPPPAVEGRVTSVRVERDRIVMLFGSQGAARKPARTGSSNYLFFRGGTIRIGRMTMTDADLRIIDQDPGDPFDFSVDGMTRQLAAGYAKLAADGGLRMFVPDFGDLRGAARSAPPAEEEGTEDDDR